MWTDHQMPPPSVFIPQSSYSVFFGVKPTYALLIPFLLSFLWWLQEDSIVSRVTSYIPMMVFRVLFHDSFTWWEKHAFILLPLLLRSLQLTVMIFPGIKISETLTSQERHSQLHRQESDSMKNSQEETGRWQRNNGSGLRVTWKEKGSQAKVSEKKDTLDSLNDENHIQIQADFFSTATETRVLRCKKTRKRLHKRFGQSFYGMRVRGSITSEETREWTTWERYFLVWQSIPD